ncbi:uncharacterized protein LOC131892890 [Tigriopus californicus]|uniref:uncharacterized protein LOC131892890 n=1 Tax=Tigriopus californicus TaxID=6832 RepID=UPI0027DAB542|nr:uncharacterized protein LOC131892890 [Tigriopus californicus]
MRVEGQYPVESVDFRSRTGLPGLGRIDPAFWPGPPAFGAGCGCESAQSFAVLLKGCGIALGVLVRHFYHRCAEAVKAGRNDSELLNTIGSHGETHLSLCEIQQQTQRLLTDCFGQYGGLPNLQTTTCGQTIFHMAMAAPVMDPDLIEQMIALRALINLTDFHGTTPLMDLIQKSRQVDQVQTVFRLALNHGKSFALNVQNCVGQSALWRAMFQGDLPIAKLLLEEGASSFTVARSMPNPGMKFPYRPEGSPRPEVYMVPACLAPLLGNSSENEIWRRKLHPVNRSKGCCKRPPNVFDVAVFNRIIHRDISPLVDLGWFCTSDVETPMKELLQETTAFGHLTKDKVFQKLAIIPLMFGHLSGGLAQLCIRHILNQVLFNQRDGVLLRHFLNSLVVTPRFVTPLGPSPFQQLGTVKSKAKPAPHRYRKSSSSSVNPGTSSSNNQEDSACVIHSGSSYNSSVTLDMSRITLSEPEMESVVPGEETTDRRMRHSSSPKSQQPPWRFDENWHLQEDPAFPRPNNTQGSAPPDSAAQQAQGIQEEVQSSLRQTEQLLAEVDSSIQDLTLFRRVEQILAEEAPAFPETDSSASSPEDAIAVPRQTKTTTTTTTTDSNSPDTTDSSSSDHTWDGVFSLRHACYKNSSSPYFNIPCAPFGPPDHEEILAFLDPSNSLELSQALGLPISLRPLVELEIARLQLGFVLYRHQSISCDRGCEGNDSDSDSWDSWSTHSGPSMTSTNDFESSLNDVESDYSSPRPFEPSIPPQPRLLSGSSSSSSSSLSSDPPIGIAVEAGAAGEAVGGADPLILDEDWFSFQDPDHDLATSARYVREHLISSDQNFNASTDSDTSVSSAEAGPAHHQ